MIFIKHKCQFCGATIKVADGEDRAACSYCGTEYTISTPRKSTNFWDYKIKKAGYERKTPEWYKWQSELIDLEMRNKRAGMKLLAGMCIVMLILWMGGAI